MRCKATKKQRVTLQIKSERFKVPCADFFCYGHPPGLSSATKQGFGRVYLRFERRLCRSTAVDRGSHTGNNANTLARSSSSKQASRKQARPMAFLHCLNKSLKSHVASTVPKVKQNNEITTAAQSIPWKVSMHHNFPAATPLGP